MRLLRGRARRWLALGTVVAATGGMVVYSTIAGAVHDEGFALQGEVDHPSLVDWVDMFDVTGAAGSTVTTPKASLPPTFVRASFAKDWTLADASAYATGTKDTLPIGDGTDGNPATGTSKWQCKSSNNLGPKFDLVNAYAAAQRVTTATAGSDEGDLIVYFGSEISSPNGSRNAGVWLLQDPAAGCTAGSGNTNFGGQHRDGDVFIVSAFTNGGTKANITVYEWVDSTPGDNNGDVGGSLQLVFASGDLNNATCPAVTDPLTATDDKACAIVNTSAEVNPPWDAPDADGGNLNVNEFYEGAINLSQLGLEECFSTVVANSRSSHEPGSTLHDFAFSSFETCGNLDVRKYIDVNANGTRDVGTDVTTGTVVGGWDFTVKGPVPSTATVCAGTTSATDGSLSCTTGSLENLPTGDYVVTETQKSGFYNTDPGDSGPFNPAATVSRTITMGLGDTTVHFGNTCYVDKTFNVRNVPAGTTGMFADWTIESGPNDGTTGTVALAINGTTATAVVNDVFTQANVISWVWGINNDHANTTNGQSNESLASGAYPACAKTNTVNFPSATLTGTKFKDANHDGVENNSSLGNDGPPGVPFTFELRTTSGTVLQTTTSSVVTGVYQFTNVAPGTYVVHEVPLAGWEQTTPTVGTDRTVVVPLGVTSVNIDKFGNTPLSDIDVSFTPQTAYTTSTISCVDMSTSGTVGSQSGDDYSADNLKTGTYVCTVTIKDP